MPALAQCPDMPGTDYLEGHESNPGTRFYEKYEFWTIPANASKSKSIDFWKTANRLNSKPLAPPPDFVCFYDPPPPRQNDYGTARPIVLHYTCKHKNGKVFWNTGYRPLYVVNKNNELTAIKTYKTADNQSPDTNMAGLGSGSKGKVSCRAKRIYDTEVFLMRPCRINWYDSIGSYRLERCGDIINYLGVVRSHQVITLMEGRARFEGF